MRELARVELLALQADCLRPPTGWPTGSAPPSRTWDGPPVSVWGDRLRLAQALGNLIANAIEHGGGAVEVLGVVGALSRASRSRIEGRASLLRSRS